MAESSTSTRSFGNDDDEENKWDTDLAPTGFAILKDDDVSIHCDHEKDESGTPTTVATTSSSEEVPPVPTDTMQDEEEDEEEEGNDKEKEHHAARSEEHRKTKRLDQLFASDSKTMEVPGECVADAMSTFSGDCIQLKFAMPTSSAPLESIQDGVESEQTNDFADFEMSMKQEAVQEDDSDYESPLKIDRHRTGHAEVAKLISPDYGSSDDEVTADEEEDDESSDEEDDDESSDEEVDDDGEPWILQHIPAVPDLNATTPSKQPTKLQQQPDPSPSNQNANDDEDQGETIDEIQKESSEDRPSRSPRHRSSKSRRHRRTRSKGAMSPKQEPAETQVEESQATGSVDHADAREAETRGEAWAYVDWMVMNLRGWVTKQRISRTWRTVPSF